MVDIIHTFLAAIEDELINALELASDLRSNQLKEILTYHMGWQDEAEKTKPRGKRIRPLLVLLSCSAAGGDWQTALPAAAAVELVHNFSLIHDDIEDRSPMRHGRTTVWKKWGIPQAINAGDAMFTLAHLQPTRLAAKISPNVTLKAVEILQRACLHLTQGQYLDLAFEKRDDVTIDDYWTMVERKTAALISASTELGALAAGCDDTRCDIYRSFGRLVGLAFQVQDDYLGIWGDAVLTGKSNQSDLQTRKKTLPVLYGLSKAGQFSQRWQRESIHKEDIIEMTNLLEIEGGKAFTLAHAAKLVNQALEELEKTHPTGETVEALITLVQSLSNRQV